MHLATLGVRAQWVHVAAAALAGGLSGLVANTWMFDSDLDALPLELAVATGVGRAAVNGLARSRWASEPSRESVAP